MNNIPESDDEWGNIPLSGLSDEKLLNTNWNFKKTITDRVHMSQVAINNFSDPEYKAKWYNAQMESMKTRNRATAKTHPQWADKLRNNYLELSKSTEYKSKHQQAIDEFHKTEQGFRNREIARQAHKKCIMTPDGEFESRNAASIHYNVTTMTMGRWLKQFPDKYYYTNK